MRTKRLNYKTLIARIPSKNSMIGSRRGGTITKKRGEQVNKVLLKLGFNTNKRIRSKQVDLNFKIKELESAIDVPNLVISHISSASENDSIVKGNLVSQEDSIKKRLEERRQASMMRCMGCINNSLCLTLPPDKQQSRYILPIRGGCSTLYFCV